MSLYTYFSYHKITTSTLNEEACNALENKFIEYMAQSGTDTVDVAELNGPIEALYYDEKLSLPKDPFVASTLNEYPENHIVITKALLYCLDNHGLSQVQVDKRRALFNLPSVARLASLKNACLIQKMNTLREEKEAKEKREADLKTCMTYTNKNETLSTQLVDFYALLEKPNEEAAMRHSLGILLAAIKKEQGDNEDEAQAVVYLRKLMLDELEADKWTFWSLIYERYHKSDSANTVEIFDDAERKALNDIDDTHNKMNFIIRLQAVGMLMGGFTFGIEVGMLILEEAAEEDVLEAWHVLLISAALCWTLGRRLGLFFFRAHIDELEKQSKENYYNAHYAQKQDTTPISMTAVVGTGAEGLLVLFGLITSGLFTCDMTVMAIRNAMGHNDTYKTDIFGTYFWNKMMDQGEWGYAVASTISLLLGVAAIGSAISLTCGHYALDGQETKEYEANQRKSAAMKMVA